MPKGPKLFTCPKCRHTYLGYDPTHDCPRCGFDDRGAAGFRWVRWDVAAYVAVILALLSVFAMSFYYRDMARMPQQNSHSNSRPNSTGNEPEKLPGARETPFQTPYQERGQ